MTTTTTPNKSTTTKTKSNGTNPEETSEQSAAASNPEAANPAQAASATKMVSISLPPSVHTKLKLLSSLTDRSVSEIATEAVTKVIQAELRAALAKVDLDA